MMNVISTIGAVGLLILLNSNKNSEKNDIKEEVKTVSDIKKKTVNNKTVLVRNNTNLSDTSPVKNDNFSDTSSVNFSDSNNRNTVSDTSVNDTLLLKAKKQKGGKEINNRIVITNPYLMSF